MGNGKEKIKKMSRQELGVATGFILCLILPFVAMWALARNDLIIAGFFFAGFGIMLVFLMDSAVILGRKGESWNE